MQSGNKSTHDAPYKKDLQDLVPDDINVVKDDSSWLHYHNELRFDVDDFDDIDGEFADFQKVELGEMKFVFYFFNLFTICNFITFSFVQTQT